MSLSSLEGTIRSATIYNTNVRDPVCLETFPTIAEGWNETVGGILLQEAPQVEFAPQQLARPDEQLLQRVNVVAPDFVTFIGENGEDPEVIQEIKRVIEDIRPSLVVYIARDGDPMMGDAFFRQMRMDLKNPHVTGKSCFLDYIHGLPFERLSEEDSIEVLTREVLQRWAHAREHRIES